MDVINYRPGSKRRYSAGMNQQDMDAYGQGLRPHEAPVRESVPTPDVQAVLAAARRCTWALTEPGHFLVPDASEEIALVALSAVREDERDGYVQHLEAFAEQHRERLEEVVRGYGPGSPPAAGYGRYFLVGQPESLIIVERMESAPFLMRAKWGDAEEDAFLLDDLEFAWGQSAHLSR
ncbi:hypothetical protein [Streptomyces xanthophaeus]|uniref:hypothetical protein n=2 Tax=Streptomyces xanthophaeus TaxID=67385 RepID=UPI00365A5B32